jgi:SAM-dependent methyltransferase
VLSTSYRANRSRAGETAFRVPDGQADVQTDDDDARDRRTLVRRGYDELADVYAAESDGTADDHGLLDRLDADAPPGRVLDAGCGDGRPTLPWFRGNRPVVGLDFSRAQATRAATTAPGRVVQGDMTGLPFADDAFAAVTAFFSVIHVPASETPAVYEEFARVLEPGGVALVTTGTDDWTGENDDWLDGGAPMAWEICGEAQSTRHLQAAGFAVTDRVGVVDALGDDDQTRLVDPDHEDADKLFLFARYEG